MGAARGALIGLIGGILTGAAELLCLVLYSVARPEDRLGSTAALGPIMGGFLSTVLGVVLGAVFGAIAEGAGLAVRGVPRCALFGVILFGIVGGFIGLAQLNDPDRPAAATAVVVAAIVASSLVGGLLAGALVGLFVRRSTPVENPVSVP
jgi:hypothetical protein